MRRLKDKAQSAIQVYRSHCRPYDSCLYRNRRVYLYERLVPPPDHILRESTRENL